MLQLNEKARDKHAWDLFLQNGIPGKENELFRYVRLRDLLSRPYDIAKPFLPNVIKEKNTLYFVNGAFCPALSQPPAQVIALTLSQALKTYGSFINSRLQKQLTEEKDPFALLNRAYAEEPLFLYIPPKIVSEPINIVHLFQSGNNATLHSPRIFLFAGREAAAKIVCKQQLEENVWSNLVVDVAIEERAEITMNFLTKHSLGAHSCLALRAALKEQSLLKTCSSTNGGSTSREDYLVRLAGERAQASLFGAWQVKESNQHHVNVLMEHQAPHCTSLQKFKGILKEASRSSFEGKILVHSVAQKTEAYQMNNNLVLGEKASANSKPNLEIFADDVKASHGATVGQLDNDHLFYLKSRGLPLELARSLLIGGFIKEIVELFEEGMQKEAYEVLG